MNDLTQPATQAPLPPSGSFQGERIASRFVLGAIAGAGAMGVVHRAWDEQAGRVVAVKLVKHAGLEGLQRFEREVTVLSRLDVPEIASYVSHGATPMGQPFLAMEWLDGETLKARGIRARLSFGETVATATSIARALAAAHALGVVHRDIKPANVMLVGAVDAYEALPGTVKVLDFGVARLRGAGETLTDTGALIGTPAFMSPEQARGARSASEVDGRSDLYALGATIFWCLTGRPPFNEEDSLALLLRLTTDRAPHIARVVPDTPAELAALVDALLEPDVGARPKSASEVARALERISAGLGSAADAIPTVLELERTVARSGSLRATGSTTPSTAASPRRLYWLLPIAVAAGAAVAVSLTFALRDSDDPSRERAPSGAESSASASPSVARAPVVADVPPPPRADPGPPASQAPSAIFEAGPMFPYRGGSYAASFECQKPAAQTWPAAPYQGLTVARELVQCDTPIGRAAISVTDTLSGNMIACADSFHVGEPMVLAQDDCTAEEREPITMGRLVGQREHIRCKRTRTEGEMRLYCDPARVPKGQSRFTVVWYMRYEGKWNAADAARFFDGLRLFPD